MAELAACSPLKAPFCPGSLCFSLESFMFLVSQGAFSLWPSLSVPGRRLCWSRASPGGSSRLDPAQAARCREQPLGKAVSHSRGSAPHATHTLRFTPGLPPSPSPIRMKDALQPLSISLGTPGTVLQPLVFLCCQSQGHLKDDAQFTELFCTLGKDPSSFFPIYFPIYQPGFSSLTPLEAVSGWGNRHRTAARCQQRLKG